MKLYHALLIVVFKFSSSDGRHRLFLAKETPSKWAEVFKFCIWIDGSIANSNEKYNSSSANSESLKSTLCKTHPAGNSRISLFRCRLLPCKFLYHCQQSSQPKSTSRKQLTNLFVAPLSITTFTTTGTLALNPSSVAFSSSSGVLTKYPLPPHISAIFSYRT